MEKKEIKAVQKAISIAGSQEKLAISLGVHRTTVNSWVRSRNKITAEMAKLIEEKTGVPRYELRPDLFL